MKPIIALCMGLLVTTSAFAATTYTDYLKTFDTRASERGYERLQREQKGLPIISGKEMRIFEDAINNGWMQALYKFTLNGNQYAVISPKEIKNPGDGRRNDPNSCGWIIEDTPDQECIFVKRVNGKWKRDVPLTTFYLGRRYVFDTSNNYRPPSLTIVTTPGKEYIVEEQWGDGYEVKAFDGLQEKLLLFNPSNLRFHDPVALMPFHVFSKEEWSDIVSVIGKDPSLPITMRSIVFTPHYLITHSNPYKAQGNIIQWMKVKNTFVPITRMGNIKEMRIAKSPSYSSLLTNKPLFFDISYWTGDYNDDDPKETYNAGAPLDPYDEKYLKSALTTTIGGYKMLSSKSVNIGKATLTCAKFSNGEKTSIGCRSSHPISTATVTSCDKNNSSSYDAPYTPTTALFNNYAFTYNISWELNNVCPIPYKISATINGKTFTTSIK